MQAHQALKFYIEDYIPEQSSNFYAKILKDF